MKTWIPPQSSFKTIQSYPENEVALQNNNVLIATVRNHVVDNHCTRTEVLDVDCDTNNHFTAILSPFLLDDGNDMYNFDRGWYRSQKYTHLFFRLSVILPFLLPTTCHALRHLHFYHPSYQQTWLNHQGINYRTNVHHGKLIRKKSSRIQNGLNDNSNDDANIVNNSNMNLMRDVDHTTETKGTLLPSIISIWEYLAYFCVSRQYNNIPNSSITNNNNTNNKNNNTKDDITRFVSTIATPEQLYDYAQYISLFRVIIPSLGYATVTKLIYPSMAMWVVSLIHGDSGIFAVVSQDASQFIQNICTTSGLAFSILIGQTYYFMYQQQEKIYYAIYDEVAMAKMVLEQISLISRGRTKLYGTILQQMDRYVRDDLQLMNDIDPATMLSSRPCDDPLEDILFLTSVGEPSQIYQSIRSLRQARSQRLGSLQMKLPEIQMTLLWILAAIVLLVFPLLGAGSQTIGGDAILQVQSWYISFLVFGISLVMGIIYELRSPNRPGAYNAGTILRIMISGLLEELQQRLQDTKFPSPLSELSEDATNEFHTSNYSTNNFDYYDSGPSVDSDGSF